MKKLFFLAAAAALVACSENPTQPDALLPNGPNLTVLTPPGVNLLVCFDGVSEGAPQSGTCTLTADHKKAFLNNTSSNSLGDYSGVYSYDLTVYGEFLTNITELSYTYKSLNVPALAPTPGVLIYEIPIDLGGDGTFDFWAIIDAAYCGVKSGATVNIVTMANCGIYAGSIGPYPNWAQFVANFPGAKVDNTINWIQIISARPMVGGVNNTWQISNVKVGKTGLICTDERNNGGYGGTCTLGSNFKSATLANTSSNSNGDLTGVYSKETTGYGLFLSNIKDLWYKYSGPVPGAGDLGYFIPIDTNGNGSSDFVASVDASTCRGTPNGAGTVFTVNITRDAACAILDGSAHTFANWAEFAAAYSNAKTVTDPDSQGYISLQAVKLFGHPSATWNILDIKWGARR